MSPDPFRIQLLTIALDSQAVLAIVGLVAAGFVFRLAARREGLDLWVGDWWDLVTAAIVGGRLLWVATHLDYYLRGPLQVVVIVDGGLHPIGLALGAAYAIRGLRRRAPAATWRLVVDLVALGAVTTFLFERTGCALTSCGAGPLAELPWALQRGTEWRQPLALYQLVVLAATLLFVAEAQPPRGLAFGAAFVGLSLVELLSIVLGAGRGDGFLALGVVLTLYLLMIRREALCPAGLSPAPARSVERAKR